MAKSNPTKQGRRKGKGKADLDLDPKTLCGACCSDVEGDSVVCCACRQWFHKDCGDLKDDEFIVLSRGNQGILWKCCNCLKAQGAENKKLLNLENKIDKMFNILSKFENSILEKLDSKIDLKLEEKLSNVEKVITNRIEEKLEERTEHNKRKDNIVVWNIPESDKADSEERNEEDSKAVYEVLGKTTDLATDSFSKIERLGKKGNRPRLIRITVKSSELKKK